MTDTPKDDDAMLAAEFALRLLQGDELAAAERRALDDRAFASQVTAWEAQFAGLTDEIAPVTPTADVKRTLLADLFPDAAPAPSFWQRAWVWQAVSAACLMLLAVVFVADFASDPVTNGPLYTAEIASEAGDFRVVAVVDKSTDEVILTLTEGSAPAGRILQVWAHGEGAPAISVGLWPEGDTVRLPMPDTIAAVEGILTIGVSEEPVGGSPTGSPSGRVFGTVDIPGVVAAL